MAAQACRGDVVMAACELLVSGDALGWMVLVFLRYVGYAEGALPVLHRAGVIGAVLGMMRGYEPEDHQLRLSLELLTLLFQMPPEWGVSWDRAPPARLERPLGTAMSRKALKRINAKEKKYVLGDVLGEGAPRAPAWALDIHTRTEPTPCLRPQPPRCSAHAGLAASAEGLERGWRARAPTRASAGAVGRGASAARSVRE